MPPYKDKDICTSPRLCAGNFVVTHLDTMVPAEPRIIADHPRSWVVAAACSWNFLWVALLKRPGAVVFAALISEYHANREQAAWVFSINMSASLLIGPVVGILTKCFSTKALSLSGSLLLSVSTILCFLSINLGALIFLLGVCNGIGTGVTMFVIEIIVCQHFLRYRASANGISYIGGTVAAFAYPPLLQILIDYYGLQGALLITGGLSLNSLAGSLLFSAPPQASSSSTAPNEGPVVSTASDSHRNQDTAANRRTQPPFPTAKNNMAYDAREAWATEHLRGQGTRRSLAVPEEREGDARLSTYGTEPLTLPANALEGKVDRPLHDNAGKYLQNSEVGAVATLLNRPHVSDDREALIPAGGQEYGTFSPQAVHSGDRSAAVHISWISHMEFLKLTDFYLAVLVRVCQTYVMLVLVVLVDFAGEKGFSKQQGAVMLSVSAIGDACARLLSGVVCDKGMLSKRTMLSANLVMAGIVCFVFPCMGSYPALLVLCVLFGWTVGSFFVLTNPFMADTVGLQHLGMAMGMSRLTAGVASFGCPKLTGYFKDSVGSYTGLFYVDGAGCFALAALWTAQAIRVKLTERAIRQRQVRVQCS